MSRSLQYFVKEVVGKAGAETELERDAVLRALNLGILRCDQRMRTAL